MPSRGCGMKSEIPCFHKSLVTIFACCHGNQKANYFPVFFLVVSRKACIWKEVAWPCTHSLSSGEQWVKGMESRCSGVCQGSTFHNEASLSASFWFEMWSNECLLENISHCFQWVLHVIVCKTSDLIFKCTVSKIWNKKIEYSGWDTKKLLETKSQWNQYT